MESVTSAQLPRSESFLAQVTPLILTFNEAPNIRRVLENLTWAQRIVIVDSGSSDETVEIARSFPNVEIHTRMFDTHAKQWSFALEAGGVVTDWVLAIDADYMVSAELADEISALRPAQSISGYRARFRYSVFGQLLSGNLYPPVAVLYRRSSAHYIQDGHTQRVLLKGDVIWLKNPIVHDDRKSMSRWLQSQSNYAALECTQLLDLRWSEMTWRQRIRRLIVIAPWLVPLHCLIVKRGLLDGLPGWHYALQRGIAEAVLSLRLVEARLASWSTPRKDR